MGNYDEFAERYARKTAELEEQTRRQFRNLLPKSLKGRKLLDVGCGSGQDALYFASQGAEVHGIDISEKEIDIAKQKNCGEFKIGNINRLPYKSNSFDVVTSFYALQASTNIPQAMKEMIRVARPRSQLLILTKHPFRNLLEGHVNDKKSDYYSRKQVTSYIFNKTITLTEPGHTMMDYLCPEVLRRVELELLEEHTDFPASEQVIPGLIYPTYMILKFRKK